MASPSQHTLLPDSLHIAQLSVRLPLGVDSWERLNPQPVTIDIQVHTDVSKAGKSDHLPYSIHYGILVKEVEKHCEQAAKEGGRRYRSLEGLADGIAKVCLFVCKAPRVTLKVQKPRSLLHAKSAAVEISRTAEDFLLADGSIAQHGEEVQDLHSVVLSSTAPSTVHDKIVIKDLLISTILGVNPWERVDKQVLKINLTIFSGLERAGRASSKTASVDTVTSPQNYRTIVRAITEYVESTSYKTVESLALSIARVAVVQNRVHRIKVRVDKPSAIMFADSAGCEVERDWTFFTQDEAIATHTSTVSKEGTAAGTHPAPTPVGTSSLKSVNGSSAATASAGESSSGQWRVAAIALGSNLGDRAGNIERAVAALESHPDCRLVDTSFLYETAPMYYTDQPKFLNGACRIATRLSPEELLDLTQSIETKVGRDKRGVPIKGPRVIDLDIIFFDTVESTSSRLTLPHEGLKEREFVLRPLADILPDYAHPTVRRTVKQLLNILVNSPEYEAADVHRVMPMPLPQRITDAASVEPDQYYTWGSKTFLMGIINATPDSFSDGGDNLSATSAIATAEQMVQQGADILDIGGMSTAPHAVEVSEEEEIARVIPVIQAIRGSANPALALVPVSVDTFRSGVARAAVQAGANVINDVTGGERDPRILDVSRELNVPIILMHTRGNSSTMGRAAHVDYSSFAGGVVEGVCAELESRVERALRAGVRRWNIVLDPGIGFAKDAEGNLDLIRGIGAITGGGGSAGLVASASPFSRSALGTNGVATPSHAGGGASGGVSASAAARVLLKRKLRDDEESLRNSSTTAAAAAVADTPSATSDVGAFVSEDHPPHVSLASFPLLLGPSRKRFIGTLTGKTDPKERVFGTAAACVAGVGGGVDILRVHDVAEMRDVAKMADAIYRPSRTRSAAP